MMASRFSRLFRLWLLASLKTFLDHLHFVLLFSKLFFFFFWQVATYAKGFARRASLTEGSARAAKSYKAKVASLTSEMAGLQA